MEAICTICNHHSNTMEKHERHMKTADHQIRAKIYTDGMEAGEYKAQSRLAALEAENAKLRETLESIEAIIQNDMGDWYDVEYAHIPIAFSNRAHIRDAINELYALLEE